MNTSQFNSQNGSFSVLDLTAHVAFNTESSISFSLERHSKSLLPTRQIGWIDLHHPCDDHIKIQIRISLPSEYHTPDKFRVIIAAVLAAAGLPGDETFEALLFSADAIMQMDQSVDREGMTDRLSAQQSAAPNIRRTGQLPASPEIWAFDSQRTSSSGGCG